MGRRSATSSTPSPNPNPNPNLVPAYRNLVLALDLALAYSPSLNPITLVGVRRVRAGKCLRHAGVITSAIARAPDAGDAAADPTLVSSGCSVSLKRIIALREG